VLFLTLTSNTSQSTAVTVFNNDIGLSIFQISNFCEYCFQDVPISKILLFLKKANSNLGVQAQVHLKTVEVNFAVTNFFSKL